MAATADSAEKSTSEMEEKNTKTFEVSEDEDDSDDVYEVEKIVARTTTKQQGKTLYRVRWLGYSAQWDTWEPYENLMSCQAMVDEYNMQQARLQAEKNMKDLDPEIFSQDTGTGTETDGDSKRQELPAQKRLKQAPPHASKNKNMKKGTKGSFYYVSSSDEDNFDTLKDKFWRDLEQGKIDVFSNDLYSKVKERRVSHGRQSTESQEGTTNYVEDSSASRKRGRKSASSSSGRIRKEREGQKRSKDSCDADSVSRSTWSDSESVASSTNSKTKGTESKKRKKKNSHGSSQDKTAKIEVKIELEDLAFVSPESPDMDEILRAQDPEIKQEESSDENDFFGAENVEKTDKPGVRQADGRTSAGNFGQQQQHLPAAVSSSSARVDTNCVSPPNMNQESQKIGASSVANKMHPIDDALDEFNEIIQDDQLDEVIELYSDDAGEDIQTLPDMAADAVTGAISQVSNSTEDYDDGFDDCDASSKSAEQDHISNTECSVVDLISLNTNSANDVSPSSSRIQPVRLQSVDSQCYVTETCIGARASADPRGALTNLSNNNNEEADCLDFDLSEISSEWHGKRIKPIPKEPLDLTNAELNEAVRANDYYRVRQALRYPKQYDLEQQDHQGFTMLMYCALKGYDDVLEILSKNGSMLNAETKTGITALMLGAEQGLRCTVELMLLMGAHMNCVAHNGETAIVKAVKKSHKVIVKLLLDYGANFSSPFNGETPVKCAKLYKNADILETVSDHIAKLTAEYENQVLLTLNNTAIIQCPLFPVQCFSLREATKFTVTFKHDLQVAQPGVGMLLFVAHAKVTPMEVRCRFYGPCAVTTAKLNNITLVPLTEEGHFVMSFTPLLMGRNELEIHTVRAPTSKAKLIVCAYKAQLL